MTAKLQRLVRMLTRIIADKKYVHLSIFKSNENRKFRQGLTLVHRLSDILRIHGRRLKGIIKPCMFQKIREVKQARARVVHTCVHVVRACARRYDITT